MNTSYSSEETLSIELSRWPYQIGFAVLRDENRKNTKHLIIAQKSYFYYQRYRSHSPVVTIPDTIGNLTELESITIHTSGMYAGICT